MTRGFVSRKYARMVERVRAMGALGVAPGSAGLIAGFAIGADHPGVPPRRRR